MSKTTSSVCLMRVNGKYRAFLKSPNGGCLPFCLLVLYSLKHNEFPQGARNPIPRYVENAGIFQNLGIEVFRTQTSGYCHCMLPLELFQTEIMKREL